jgi:hypothetical protein
MLRTSFAATGCLVDAIEIAISRAETCEADTSMRSSFTQSPDSAIHVGPFRGNSRHAFSIPCFLIPFLIVSLILTAAAPNIKEKIGISNAITFRRGTQSDRLAGLILVAMTIRMCGRCPSFSAT